MFFTMDQIKQANHEAGGYWFSPGARRFFRSRLGRTVYRGRYFVSSEQQDDNHPRRYTIRRAGDDGRISTVGEFQEYATRANAVAAIQNIK